MEPTVNLGNVITRLGAKIGDLEAQNALLTAQIEAYQAKHQELDKQKENQEEATNDKEG